MAERELREYYLPTFQQAIQSGAKTVMINSGEIILQLAAKYPKIIYLKNEVNLGVGGAMKTGFRKALELNVDIIIKIDGDGQMDISNIPKLIQPLIENKADFTKGNRFKNYSALQSMPIVRRIGNIGLSFLTKAASGYWNIFDPTNGYVAINNETLKNLDQKNLHNRYFFESSLLIELYHVNAVIVDVPMAALYGDEISNLSINKTLIEFPPKLTYAFLRRILLKYFIYDFNIASLYLLVGIPLLTFGLVYGIDNFYKFTSLGIAAPTGTVVIPTLMITLGFQLLLNAINFDITNYPKK
ncbi:MAG: glycosyltransferase family 2 protein, partial [Cytophagales bacterium]|nr:glycosyltransferase family 2 protein [Cytophagales bacterium]